MVKIGIANLLDTSMRTAMSLMSFLNKRDQKKLRERHQEIIEEFNKQKDARYPNYNDVKKGKAKRAMLQFISDTTLLAEGKEI